jgi:hypothetical protein
MDEAMMEHANHMDCAQFEDIVDELDRPGTRGAQLREIALIHAESCGRCAVLLSETESLDFALVKLADESERIVVPSRVNAALLQEFRRTKAISSKRRVQRRIAAIGAAAALFLALGFSLQRIYTPSRGLGGTSQANLAKSAPEADRSTTESPRKTVEVRLGKKSVASHIAPRASGEPNETEIDQNFTRLPYADDPSMMEGGSVVRVILSRSALASFGVPLSDVENREQIPADLVVSADGTPEAIRLVAQNVD